MVIISDKKKKKKKKVIKMGARYWQARHYAQLVVSLWMNRAHFTTDLHTHILSRNSQYEHHHLFGINNHQKNKKNKKTQRNSPPGEEIYNPISIFINPTQAR